MIIPEGKVILALRVSLTYLGEDGPSLRAPSGFPHRDALAPDCHRRRLHHCVPELDVDPVLAVRQESHGRCLFRQLPAVVLVLLSEP